MLWTLYAGTEAARPQDASYHVLLGCAAYPWRYLEDNARLLGDITGCIVKILATAVGDMVFDWKKMMVNTLDILQYCL